MAAKKKKTTKKPAAKPIQGEVMPATALVVPANISLSHTGDAELKEQEAAVNVMVARLEKTLKLENAALKKKKKKLEEQRPALDKARSAVMTKLADEVGAPIVDEIRGVITFLPIKTKKFHSEVSNGALVNNGTKMIVDIEAGGQDPHVRFNASIEVKVNAGVKSAMAAVRKLDAEIAEVANRMLAVHRSIANLDTAERQARAMCSETLLAQSESGQAVLDEIEAGLDTQKLLLEG